MIDQRRHHILSALASQGRVEITELAQTLNVSVMTIHRDLDTLEQAGHLQKVRGGAVQTIAVEAEGNRDVGAEVCMACFAPVTVRTQVTLHLQDGSRQRACCPHCGLMVLARIPAQVSGFLVTDFLNGLMVNGRTAIYLAAPDLAICCTPSMLAFEDKKNAERFQVGFGGTLMALDEAIVFVRTSMHLAS